MSNEYEVRPDDFSGRFFLGRYRVIRELATGGMGVVYLARVEGAEGFVKPVVVKLILPSYSARKDFLKMFVQEAQILSEVRHPGIVTVLDFAEENGSYVMVLEYVHGFQLYEWNDYLGDIGRRIPTEVALQVMINVLDALDHVHALKDNDGAPLQIIHRDISPTNILIDTQGRTKLLDFGISRTAADASESEGSSRTSFRGKLPYAAPELFMKHELSIQSDVYACGVTLHEILVGQNEFHTGHFAKTMHKVLHHAPSLVSGVREDAPKGLDDVLRKALAKEPAARFKTAGEFAAALRQVHSTTEHEANRRLAKLVHQDFGDEMASHLNVVSLQMRERAWRTFSEESLAPRPAYRREHTGKTVTLAKKPVGRTFPTWVKALLAVITLFLIAGVTLFAIYMDKARPKDEQKFFLVQSSVSDNTETEPVDAGVVSTLVNTSASAEVAQPVVPTPELEATAEPEKAAPRAPKKPKKRIVSKPKSAPAEPSVKALTAAFKRKKHQTQSCIQRYSKEMDTVPRLSILFNIDSLGKVQKAQISPSRIAGTPLGKCIANVARRTKFPAQKGPVSFEIPLTVSRMKN